MEWHLLGILAFVVIYNIWRYYHEDDNTDYRPLTEVTNSDNQVEETKMEEKISTRQLALNTIERIGSEPKYTVEGRIQFEYQGILFLMEAVNDCMFVNLIWPWCHSFSKFDIDEFARVRQVVNDINAMHFLLVPQIPDLEEYLKIMLGCFFRTARTLDVEIEKYRLQECER